ncbi:MAG: metal-dependent hydrolase [Nitrospinota bacterium]|nr:metal-dependent hydrolase [Nitrospinota bacterium]
MPTPLGHTLAGLAVWAVARKPVSLKEAFTRENVGWAAVCALAANLPDADFIHISDGAIILSGKFHHGITHSIGFALAMGGIVAGWAWTRRVWDRRAWDRRAARPGATSFATPNPATVFFITTLCLLTHVFLDIFSVDTYAANGIGLPVLWPLTRENFILPLIDGVDRSNLFTRETAVVMGKEALALGGIFVAAAYAAGRKTPQRAASPANSQETAT